MVKNINGDIYSDLITEARPEVFWGGGQRNTSAIRYIVIHGTATTNEGVVYSTWKKGSGRQASAHYLVTPTKTVGCMGENSVAWHSGGTGAITNHNSIGVEHINSSIGNVADAGTYLFDNATLERGAKLVADICKRYGLKPNASTIVPHRQVSATACPQTLNMSWYIGRVQHYYNGGSAQATQQAKPTQTKAQPAKAGKSIDELAREVIAGKHGSGDARRKALGPQYDAVQKRVNEILGSKSAPAKSIDQLAREVIAGKHGSGEARKRSLGSQYAAVQARVSELMGKKATPAKSIDELAREVIAGKHGSGEARKRSLGSQYAAVQARVNQLLRK